MKSEEALFQPDHLLSFRVGRIRVRLIGSWHSFAIQNLLATKDLLMKITHG